MTRLIFVLLCVISSPLLIIIIFISYIPYILPYKIPNYKDYGYNLLHDEGQIKENKDNLFIKNSGCTWKVDKPNTRYFFPNISITNVRIENSLDYDNDGVFLHLLGRIRVMVFGEDPYNKNSDNPYIRSYFYWKDEPYLYVKDNRKNYYLPDNIRDYKNLKVYTSPYREKGALWSITVYDSAYKMNEAERVVFYYRPSANEKVEGMIDSCIKQLMKKDKVEGAYNIPAEKSFSL